MAWLGVMRSVIGWLRNSALQCHHPRHQPLRRHYVLEQHNIKAIQGCQEGPFLPAHFLAHHLCQIPHYLTIEISSLVF